MTLRALDPAARDLLKLVSRAAFENPFSPERDDLDRRIAGSAARGPELLAALLARLAGFLSDLGGAGPVRVTDFGGEDRDLVEHAVLFSVFHGFMNPLDDLIERQVAAGRAPCSVGFSDDLLGVLAGHGFEASRAVRLLTLFFQMRRAFFFITHSLTGRSRCMGRLRQSLWDNVFTRDIALYERFLWNRMEDFSTILLGETGTGKGAAAAAIGRSGFIPFDERRRCFEVSFTDTFVPINLSQFPETLIESELFGHKKGAFTGAVDNHDGVFTRSGPHGSIFLDEIGEVSVPVQIKLLHVLQDRVYTPVGSHEERRFAGRVIAATHRPLDQLRSERRFRDDFYYRLCSDVVPVPPLRQRLAEEPGELTDLVTHIILRIVGEAAPELASMVNAAVMRDLGPAYPWPGNVRELEQCVRRVLLTGRCQADARAQSVAGPEGRLLSAAQGGELDARELVGAYCALLHQRLGTYEAVARITGLDRRTVKKHVLEATRSEH